MLALDLRTNKEEEGIELRMADLEITTGRDDTEDTGMFSLT